MITALLRLLTLLVVVAPDSQQQTPVSVPAPATAFDVVSIKPSNSNNGGFAIKPEPNSLTVTGASIEFLVQYAYDLHDFQIEEAPAWMSSARFDILAKLETPALLVVARVGRSFRRLPITPASGRDEAGLLG
jgi:hypothetical protein